MQRGWVAELESDVTRAEVVRGFAQSGAFIRDTAPVGLQRTNQPGWVFMDSDADLSHIDRDEIRVKASIRLDPAATDKSWLRIPGALSWNMQDFAS